jgi:flagellar basal-body rod protein FlgF
VRPGAGRGAVKRSCRLPIIKGDHPRVASSLRGRGSADTGSEEAFLIRGLYTGASGMVAQMHRLDAIANNLANVDLVGYKEDIPVLKSFPEILLRRMDDDGVVKLGFASIDKAPVVGRLGTGVEENEVYTDFSQGSVQRTENPFDFALDGKGFLTVSKDGGERYTRNGSFLINDQGYLVDKDGDFVLGEKGPIRLKANNFVVDQDGNVWQNSDLAADPQRLVSPEENDWQGIELVDRLKVVDFDRTRYLRKQGDSMWKDTEESGPARIVPEGRRPKVLEGFLEKSNVNVVTEMVRMIEVNRTYEANQKLIQTHDSLLGELINQAMRL